MAVLDLTSFDSRIVEFLSFVSWMKSLGLSDSSCFFSVAIGDWWQLATGRWLAHAYIPCQSIR
jgi:hypothetical protein